VRAQAERGRAFLRVLPRPARPVVQARGERDESRRTRLRLLPRGGARSIHLHACQRRCRRLHELPRSTWLLVSPPAAAGDDRRAVSRVSLDALDGDPGLAAAFFPQHLAAAVSELHDLPRRRARFPALAAAFEVRTGRCEHSAPPSSSPRSPRLSVRPASPLPRRFRSASRSATASSASSAARRLTARRSTSARDFSCAAATSEPTARQTASRRLDAGLTGAYRLRLTYQHFDQFSALAGFANPLGATIGQQTWDRTRN